MGAAWKWRVWEIYEEVKSKRWISVGRGGSKIEEERYLEKRELENVASYSFKAERHCFGGPYPASTSHESKIWIKIIKNSHTFLSMDEDIKIKL